MLGSADRADEIEHPNNDF